MEKIPKRIENSYKTYLKYRASYAKRGYGLDRQLTKSEYAEAHKAFSHRGATHIAREIAEGDTTFSRREASAILRRIQSASDYDYDIDKFELEALRAKYRKAKDIYGLQLSEEEMAANEARRYEAIIERSKGKAPEYTIQASARSLLFNQLRDAGLSYKDAEVVLYG